MISTILLVLHGLLVLAAAMRVLLRDDLSPDKRMAWLMVLTLLPYVGVVLYYLLGEINLGRRLTGRHQPVALFMRKHWPDNAPVQHMLGKPEDIGKGVEFLRQISDHHPEAQEELKKYKKGLFGGWKRR